MPGRTMKGPPCVVRRWVPFLPAIEVLIRDSDDIRQMAARVYCEVLHGVDGWSCWWLVDNGKMEQLFVFWVLLGRHLCDDDGRLLLPMSWIEKNCEQQHFRRSVSH